MAKTILVVDDEELLTKTFTRLLEKSGYEVYVAKNAQHALDMVEELDFDLIITDVRMPGMDGIDILKEIRQRDNSKDKPNRIPEIVVTGYASDEKEAQARE